MGRERKRPELMIQVLEAAHFNGRQPRHAPLDVAVGEELHGAAAQLRRAHQGPVQTARDREMRAEQQPPGIRGQEADFGKGIDH